MKTEDNNNIFINKGLFRTPLLPLCSIEELNSKILREFAERPLIQEAIFLSSITFHKEIRKWLNGNQKDPKKISQIELSLYKYITRISSRSTPFGLFASTGFVDIGCNSKLSNVLIGEDVKIFTRLDPSALQKIINYFNQNEELKNILKYTINNSIYSFGNNDIRYFEKTINKNEISFELSSVDYNYYLNEIIKFCNTPRSFREIISNCFEYNLNTNDVVAFFNQLLDEKLLLSELEIILTTYNPLQKFIDLLNDRIKSSNPSKELTQKIKKIERINQILNGNSSVINKHNEISSILKVYNININPNDIIHSDSKRDIISPITLNPNLIDAKNILLKLTPPKKDSFEQFKKNFRRRYENRTMPLLQILDPESGIGYRQTGETGDDLFLLKKIKFDFVNNVEFTLSQIDEFLLKKIIKLKESNSKEINLNLEELSIFSSKKNSDLDTGCVIFSIIDKDNSILLDGFNGPSTLNIINRFSYLDERTINLAEYLVNEEQKINTTSFLAEITHLPDFKTGNLLFYKPFRDFEIPCVTESDLINEHKILLSDLSIRMVSHLNNSRIQLISSKLNKPVLPRLSNSVNYNRKSMDVFKFLSDLQYQDSPRSLKFNWGSVAKFLFPKS